MPDLYRFSRLPTGILTACGLLGGLAAQAQTAAPRADSTRSKTHDLNEVVVVATRTETRLAKLPQKIDVISRKDLELTPAHDLTDVLKKTASVNVIQYPSLLSGVGIRGFRPQFSGLNQRTLLLLDGRPAGATNLSTISLNNVERIEVLKGPASALYGSQAMGGVLNVITRKSTGPIRTNLFVEAGSFTTIQAGLNSGGTLVGKLDYDVSFSYFDRAKEYRIGQDNLLRDLLGYDTATRNYTDQPSAEIDDRRSDGETRPNTRFSYYTGTLRLGYQLSEKLRVDVRGEQFLADDVESPGDITNGNADATSKDLGRYGGEVSLTGTFGPHQPSLRAYTSEENVDGSTRFTNFLPIVPFRSAAANNSFRGVQLKDTWTLGPHALTVGLDYYSSATKARRYTSAGLEVAPTSPNYAIVSTAAFAQANLRFLQEKLIVQPGLRYDQIAFDVRATPLLTTFQPGKVTTPFVSPSLGAVYQLTKPLRVKATVGRAFVTPDAFNVAGNSEVRSTVGAAPAGTGRVNTTLGNPDLRNENSLSWDAGLGLNLPQAGLSADLTYFSTNVRDRITRVVTQVNQRLPNNDLLVSTATYQNANDSQIRGLEAEVAYDFGWVRQYAYSVRVFANSTTLLTAEESLRAADGSTIVRDVTNVNKYGVNYGLEYDNYKWLRTRLTGRYAGGRKDTDFTDAANPEIEYANYMILDFVVACTLQDRHTLSLQVSNLTDENYYEKRGYNLPGRAFALRYALAL